MPNTQDTQQTLYKADKPKYNLVYTYLHKVKCQKHTLVNCSKPIKLWHIIIKWLLNGKVFIKSVSSSKLNSNVYWDLSLRDIYRYKEEYRHNEDKKNNVLQAPKETGFE